jgi:hypothetical protein
MKNAFNFSYFTFQPTERVNLCQWLKKLSELRNEKRSELKMKHEYLQYLRVTLQGDYQVLTKPFNMPPPDDLIPFAECIANKTADAIPDVPRAGEWDFKCSLNIHENEDKFSNYRKTAADFMSQVGG